MVAWRELPRLVGSRVAETVEHFGFTSIRFDSDLYLFVEGHADIPSKLTFKLYLTQDGTPMRFPLAKMSPLWEGKGDPYRFAALYYAPPKRLRGIGDEVPRLEGIRAMLGTKRGSLVIEMRTRTVGLGANWPAWRALAAIEAHAVPPVADNADLARRINGTIDDLRQLMLDAVERCRFRPLKPR